jgi:hypothetical protein
MSMQVKFSVKCWVKAVTRSSMKTLPCNIKKYVPSINLSHRQAFVIHCSHDSVTIYFAILPNEYLAAIAQDGRHYLKQSHSIPTVHLHHIRKYHMWAASEIARLFQVLVNLLYYLSSGEAHVGYLFNYDDNPLHKLVCRRLWQLC